MKPRPGSSTLYNVLALPFVVAAAIWLAVGVPNSMLWLLALLFVIGGALAWRGKRLHDAETQERGDAYLQRLKDNPPG